jgi:hypothetical protein
VKFSDFIPLFICKTTPWSFHVLYPSFDVEGFPGYPSELPPNWKDNIPTYDGDCNSATSHIASFLVFISSINVTHEAVLMRLFVYSLEGDPRTWIKTCSRPKKISSLAGLIQAFLKYWDPTQKEDQRKMDESNADFEDKLEEDSIEDEVLQESVEDQVHQGQGHEEGDQASIPPCHEDKRLIREQLEEENVENLQPSYMCKKSEFEDPFMAVTCMRFADFYCRIFQPCLSSTFPQCVVENLAGKCTFDAVICTGLEGIQVLVCCSNFQPPVKA